MKRSHPTQLVQPCIASNSAKTQLVYRVPHGGESSLWPKVGWLDEDPRVKYRTSGQHPPTNLGVRPAYWVSKANGSIAIIVTNLMNNYHFLVAAFAGCRGSSLGHVVCAIRARNHIAHRTFQVRTSIARRR